MSHLLAAVLCLAQPPVADPGPLSPEVSLAAMKPRPGFKVELMAAEPLVQDPIAFAFGPDGKLWVVEMGDYPLGVDGRGKAGGRIKYLEKTKPDGPYDRATVFLDGLGYPTSVLPYDGGVLFACAPDIVHVAIDAGGKAGARSILFTGFREGNQQHRVNGLAFGVDNWIYGANGDSGGTVKSLKTGRTTDIRGRDFRFKVETGEFEAVSGQAQFGRGNDDWGNWFGNNNSNPMFHYVLDDRSLRRNPHVLYPDVKVSVPIERGAARVFPISKPLPRFNAPASLNHFTSACSTILYRDTLFGPEFEGNAFVSEPVHNLVHREIVSAKGMTFESRRADDEQRSEFLASTDNWFRPTMIQVGPDGALWIADMYRYVIEHPQWIPREWQSKLDLRAGHDKGRLYRIYPEKAAPRSVPRLDRMSPKELVAQLASPSGWVRDAAQHLLVRRGQGVEVRGDLERAMKSHPSPLARLHAAYAFRAIADNGSLAPLLDEPHPGVRKHAIACCADDRAAELEARLPKLVDDADPHCRLQAAYALGEFKSAAPSIAAILAKDNQDAYLFAAGLSSISKDNFRIVLDEAMKRPKLPLAAIAPLLRLAKAYGEPRDAARIVIASLEAKASAPIAELLVQAGDLIDALERNDTSLKGALDDIAPSGAAVARLKTLHSKAHEILANPRSPHGDRSLAIRLLSRGIDDDARDRKVLAGLLTPQSPDDLQSAAIRQLRGDAAGDVATLLLAPWKSYSPSLRVQALDALLSRPAWTGAVLEAIAQKSLSPNEFDAEARQRLLRHRETAIRAAAQGIFAGSSNVDRGKVIAEYASKLPATSDLARGAKVFAKSCAVCHKLGDVGQPVGPDLASIGDKSVDGLLLAIFDPNRAVEPRYVGYIATTRAGVTATGILAAETSTSITLIGADGKAKQLLRNELDELASTGRSLMPEGMERDLSAQDVADVIALIRAGTKGP